MKPSEIRINRVYQGMGTHRRKVLGLLGRGRNRQVKYRTGQQTPAYLPIGAFAEWAVEDVTPAPTALVGRAL